MKILSDRPKHLPTGWAFALFLICCNSHPAADAGKNTPTNHVADSTQQSIASDASKLTISPALLKKYQEACLHDTTSYDKKFIANFFDIINRFDGKKLDTTILTIGNLDGGKDQDSIWSRVYYDGDSIYVDSKWVKNNLVLWKDKYSNPYTELNADLFNDSSKNIWLFFAIGIVYGPPDFHRRNELDPSALGMVYDQGAADLKSDGISIDKEQYKRYLEGFKGDLLAFGEPESREGLWIWYKPAGRLITYYHP